MTKEEIINKYAFVERRESDFGQAPAYDFKYLAYGNAEKAMDEYAKQQAIAFAEWAFKDDNPFVEGSNGRWIQQSGNSSSWSTEELYNIFIEQQNKDNDK